MLDLLKKWWLYAIIFILGAATVIALVLRLGRKESPAEGIVGALQTIRNNKTVELAAHNAMVESERQGIAAAEAIPDKAKRLQALADIANRHKP